MHDTLPPGALASFDLWPDGPPAGLDNPGTERIFPNPDRAVPERWIRNITRPTLTHFPATGPRRGLSMLIVPGGAFHFVSIDNEGYDLARALAAQGIDGFVLKYRVSPMPEDDDDIPAFLTRMNAMFDHPAQGETAPPSGAVEVEAGRALAEADGRQAMRLLRARADDLGIGAAQLGVIGFSAGGGVAADLALAAPADCRPDFAAPIYPAWRAVPIPPDLPPMFLATAADDTAVAPFSTARLAEICHRAGGRVALHVYGDGGHGFGIRKQGKLSDRWFIDFIDWLDRL
jgi:acetyl esterase/lipase